MINRHTNEESEEGEGVEVIRNEPCFDEDHGDGQITEKRIHLNRYFYITDIPQGILYHQSFFVMYFYKLSLRPYESSSTF